MGAYSVPEEIRKMKPRGTTVKVIGGKFYVYTNSRHKDEQTGKWKTDPGKLVGRIIEGIGFVPKGTNAELSQKNTVFQYGEYLLACRLGLADLELLKQCVNAEQAFQLFALACIFRFEGYIGMAPAEEIFKQTLIARDYPELKFSYHRISKLLSDLGRSEALFEYQKKCAQLASTVAVDGHVIPSNNEGTDLSFNGYKAREIHSEQMNLLVALDVNSHLPFATRVFPGYMVDKSDFIEFIRFLGSIKDKLFLMDSGFYSKCNIDFLTENQANFIMPLSSNLTAYKDVVKLLRGRLSQFLYSSAKGADLVEYRESTSADGIRTIFFRNLSDRERLLKAYMQKLEEGAAGHTQSGLEKGRKSFGVIVLQTSLSQDLKSAEEIYGLYKKRWTIETYYDRIKNSIDFSELNLSEYGLAQGIAFVMMLAGRIDQRILEASRKIGKNSTDLVRLMRALKLFDNGKSACVSNAKKEHMEIAKALGFTYDTSHPCLAA